MPCQSRCIRKLAGFLDHRVRLEEDREWNGEAQFLRGLEVDHHDQLRRDLYRQVTRRGAVQDFVHERGCWTAYLK